MTEPDQVTYLRTDVVTDRVNALTTTFLDVLGALMVAFSAGWAVWGTPWRHALAAAVAGLAVMLLSGMAQRRDLPAKRPGETPVALVQPGPADPGNLHISGR